MKHSEPPPQVQEPPVQPSAVLPHELPQDPQLLPLVWVLMQVPLQQLSEPPHVRPHAPQFATLALVSAHAPLQQAWLPTHRAPLPHRQVPPMQTSPAPHAGLHGMSVVHEPPMHA